MSPARSLPALLLLPCLAACPAGSEPVPEPPPDVADLVYPDFSDWAEPIADYVAAGEDEYGPGGFDSSIHDLHVFADRLYLGYGDATVNMGRIFPIDVRRWDEAEAGGWASEFTTDEEQIDRYRSAGDLLVVPGIDATEDAWIGNAYTLREGGPWVKSRTLDQALHVHDALIDGDAIWACGSGGTQPEYEAGAISSLLFRSDDGGITFALAHKVPNAWPVGDARFTDLALLDGVLHAFGYRTDDSWSITDLIAYRLEGDEMAEWDGADDLWTWGTQATGDGRALAWGVDLGGWTARFGTRILDPEGSSDLETADDLTTLDMEPQSSGRVLIAALDGDSWAPGYPEGPWDLVVALWGPGEGDWTILVEQEIAVLPTSIAFWRGALYMGTSDGRVLRAAGEAG